MSEIPQQPLRPALESKKGFGPVLDPSYGEHLQKLVQRLNIAKDQQVAIRKLITNLMSYDEGFDDFNISNFSDTEQKSIRLAIREVQELRKSGEKLNLESFADILNTLLVISRGSFADQLVIHDGRLWLEPSPILKPISPLKEY